MPEIYGTLHFRLSEAGQRVAILAGQPAKCEQERRILVQPQDVALLEVDADGNLSGRVPRPLEKNEQYDWGPSEFQVPLLAFDQYPTDEELLEAFRVNMKAWVPWIKEAQNQGFF
jgi:hypothetical protein